jgi:hypothetical protein
METRDYTAAPPTPLTDLHSTRLIGLSTVTNSPSILRRRRNELEHARSLNDGQHSIVCHLRPFRTINNGTEHYLIEPIENVRRNY